jgi:DNA-binding NarL/FixJ family response regulator
MTAERTRIFLVEDQPAVLRALDKALRAYPELELVGSARDGEQAVEAIVRLQPQLALVDLELPGLDGIGVVRKVRRRAAQVELLVLTSFDDEHKVFEAISAGASGYLLKRVGPERIRAAIAEVMAGGTVLEAVIARRFWNLFQAQRPQGVPAGNRWGLSAVEVEVLRFVAKGLSNAEVGQVLYLERRTVRTHLAHIYRKLGVSSHVEAVVAAVRAGLVEP